MAQTAPCISPTVKPYQGPLPQRLLPPLHAPSASPSRLSSCLQSLETVPIPTKLWLLQASHSPYHHHLTDYLLRDLQYHRCSLIIPSQSQIPKNTPLTPLHFGNSHWLPNTHWVPWSSPVFKACLVVAFVSYGPCYCLSLPRMSVVRSTKGLQRNCSPCVSHQQDLEMSPCGPPGSGFSHLSSAATWRHSWRMKQRPWSCCQHLAPPRNPFRGSCFYSS